MKPIADDLDRRLSPLLEALGCSCVTADIPPEHRAHILAFLEEEQLLRHERRMQRLMAASGIKPAQVRTFESFDWSFNPRIPKADLLLFRNSDWIDQARNLVLIGDVGLGKSHIAKALCCDAIAKGYSARFISIFDLLAKIQRAPQPVTRVELFGSRIKVLAIDELGYTSPSREAQDLLFQIIAKRNESLPTIVTTNLVPKDWGKIFSGPTASAILDRLHARGLFITMQGDTYRPTIPLKKSKTA